MKVFRLLHPKKVCMNAHKRDWLHVHFLKSKYNFETKKISRKFNHYFPFSKRKKFPNCVQPAFHAFPFPFFKPFFTSGINIESCFYLMQQKELVLCERNAHNN